MSAESDGDRIANPDAIAETLQRWYHVPAIAAVVAFMLWARTRAYDNFVRDDTVYLGGNDPYYHLRSTTYTVENWPRRLYGDAWTQFPFGSNVGQYGTLMDQVVGTAALIVGLGDPSSRQIAIVAVVAPAVIAALIAVPVYFLAKQLSGSRIGGVTAAVILALIPQGGWVRRGTVGFYDHHIAESLMMAIAVFGMVYALSKVRRERPVFEQVQDRDWDGLKPTVTASTLAGIALAAYLLTWPSGVVLVGIFGVFFVIAMTFAVATGRSPEHLAFTGTISLTVALVVTLPFVQSLEATTTTLSLLQVLALSGVAAACAVMGALARYWEREDLEAWGYPAVIGVLGIVTIGVLWLVLPELVRSVWTNMERILFLGQSDNTLTISEAQSMFADNRPPVGEQFWNGYGFTAFTALGALLWMTARGFLAERPKEEYLLIAVWTIFVLLMTLTQVRFHYYLVLPVAVLNGWLVVQIARLAAFPSLADFKDIQTYQVLTIIAVIMLLVVPIAGPLAVATSAEQAENNGPGSVVFWDDNLDWMEENTPVPGTYGGADNEMSYYGPYDSIDDYEYPEGAYGVMSWWDYGHWITTEGERIPVANPFQQGATSASAYFQETNESRANMYLEALPSGEIGGGALYSANESELQAAIDARTEQEAGEETRYVMIDDQMAGGKFSAITEWTGPGSGAYYGQQEFPTGNDSSVSLPALSDQYDSTMLARMYFNDGSSVGQANANALEHYRLVYESPTQSTVLSIARQTQNGLEGTGLVGIDIGTLQQYYPSVYSSISSGTGPYVPYDIRSESAVKTYERVEGATITGEAEPNQTVQASVELETNTGRTFTYAQSTTVGEDGQFAITVPYATTNDLGTEDGYTNSSVLANGTYTVSAGNFLNIQAEAENVSVPEQAIYDGDTIDVDLEEVEDSDGSNGTNGTDGGNQTGNATSIDTASGSSAITASGSSADATSAGSPAGDSVSASSTTSAAQSQSTANSYSTAAVTASVTQAFDGVSSGLSAFASDLAAPVRATVDPLQNLPLVG
ncbi:oligosaccharyl transferase, archaeosortase A system-associated [Salinarchaeum chitinilyticum]